MDLCGDLVEADWLMLDQAGAYELVWWKTEKVEVIWGKAGADGSIWSQAGADELLWGQGHAFLLVCSQVEANG